MEIMQPLAWVATLIFLVETLSVVKEATFDYQREQGVLQNQVALLTFIQHLENLVVHLRLLADLHLCEQEMFQPRRPQILAIYLSLLAMQNWVAQVIFFFLQENQRSRQATSEYLVETSELFPDLIMLSSDHPLELLKLSRALRMQHHLAR